MAIEELSSGGQPKPPDIDVELSATLPWSVDGPHGTDLSSRNINQPNFPWYVDGSFGTRNTQEGFIVPDHGSPIRPKGELDVHAVNHEEDLPRKGDIFVAGRESSTF